MKSLDCPRNGSDTHKGLQQALKLMQMCNPVALSQITRRTLELSNGDMCTAFPNFSTGSQAPAILRVPSIGLPSTFPNHGHRCADKAHTMRMLFY